MAKRRTCVGDITLTGDQSSEKLCAQIKSTFDRLPLRQGKDEHLRHTVSRLAKIAIDRTKPNQAQNAFAPANRATCEAELNSLIRVADDLVNIVSGLHQPTILALADAGLLRAHLHQIAVQIKEAVARADVSKVDPQLPKGRHRDEFARMIAGYLANQFHFLTGETPTIRVHTPPHPSAGKAYGPFLELITDVFSAMNIKASPETFAREAVDSFANRDDEALNAQHEQNKADGMKYLVRWWNDLSPQERDAQPSYMPKLIADWGAAHPPANGENTLPERDH